MPRPIWKGHISFGLVNIPVTLYSAETRNNLSFNLLDSRNQAKVRYERVNELTGEEVPWDKIVKAFEYSDGHYVLMSDDDFKKAAVENSQTVEIEDFVDREEIDTVFFDKPYYLVPGKKGEKGYVLLRETLKRTNKVGIAKVVIRTKQYLAALITEGPMLVLDLLRFAQEIRPITDYELPSEDLKEVGISEKELKMAEQLVESMTSPWRPEEYHDDYREALMNWITKKAEADGEITPPSEEEEEAAPAGEIVDIMGLLKQSMEKRGKGGEKSGAKPKAKSSAQSQSKSKSRSKPKAKAKSSSKSSSRKKASGEN